VGARADEDRDMSPEKMIDTEFIRSMLTVDDPWCASHGSGDGSDDLGAGMLYYGLAYSLRARTCVCLGSGGGFVPRLMRQAQRDLDLADSRTILVDGAPYVRKEREEIWGSPCWLDEASTFRTNYPDVEIVLELTDRAFAKIFLPQRICIDYLHIDADHHYDGVKQDWDLFHPLVSSTGVITLHDTVNYREPCGVPRLVEEIQETGEYEVINFPIAYGTAIVKKTLGTDENIAASRSSLSAIARRRE
jgi:hypothetical protein